MIYWWMVAGWWPARLINRVWIGRHSLIYAANFSSVIRCRRMDNNNISVNNDNNERLSSQVTRANSAIVLLSGNRLTSRIDGLLWSFYFIWSLWNVKTENHQSDGWWVLGPRRMLSKATVFKYHSKFKLIKKIIMMSMNGLRCIKMSEIIDHWWPVRAQSSRFEYQVQGNGALMLSSFSSVQTLLCY